MHIPFLTTRSRAATAALCADEAKASRTGPLIAFQSHQSSSLKVSWLWGERAWSPAGACIPDPEDWF